MFRARLTVPVVLMLLHAGFAAAQQRFELVVPSTATRSMAELTATSLSITNQGQVTVYSRDAKYDTPGFTGYSSNTARQAIRWPNSNSGSMQFAEITLLRAPRFKQSQMQIRPMAATPAKNPSTNLFGTGTARSGSATAAGPVDLMQDYRLTNAHLGPGRSLDTDRHGVTGMAATGDFDAQTWRFADGGVGTYRIGNAALGNGFSLTANGPNQQPTMERSDPRSDAQRWRLTKQGNEFRITNEAMGTRWSLDTSGSGANEPFLAATDNLTGQFWTVAKLASTGIVGVWQEREVGTGAPKGITVNIKNDLSFRQTQLGQQDVVGMIRLVGNQLSIHHNRGTVERFLVKQTPDRVDFRDPSGSPLGFYWHRVAAAATSPLPSLPQPRRLSQKIVPNPALAPVAVELVNTHSEELWVLVTDLRDATKTGRVKLLPGRSVVVQFDRDAGSKTVETWEIPGKGTEQRESQIPPKQFYDISVYELFAQSISIDASQPGPQRVESVNKAPKSVGMINVPPGAGFKAGKTDIYAVAKRQRNAGAVRRIDPAKWGLSTPSNDPFKRLIPRR